MKNDKDIFVSMVIVKDKDNCNILGQLYSMINQMCDVKIKHNLLILTDKNSKPIIENMINSKIKRKLTFNINYSILMNLEEDTESERENWKFVNNKLQVINLCKCYRKVVFLDCDIYINRNFDNIFRKLKKNCYNTCHESLYCSKEEMKGYSKTNSGIFGFYYTDKSLIDMDFIGVKSSFDYLKPMEEGALETWFKNLTNREHILEQGYNLSDIDYMYLYCQNKLPKLYIMHLWNKGVTEFTDENYCGMGGFVNSYTLNVLKNQISKYNDYIKEFKNEN